MGAPLIFQDRESAAAMLAERLQQYKGCHPLVLAIPRGAVPMGRVLACLLGGELDVVLVHKIGAPANPECAIGAIDETGWSYLDIQPPAALCNAVEALKAKQLSALKRRRALYTPYLHAVDPRGRVVIVVDDGAATGSTMIAALHAVRSRQPAELVCALPVASQAGIDKIAPYADKVVCLQAPPYFEAVSQFYRDFEQVEDEDVERVLAAARRDGGASLSCSVPGATGTVQGTPAHKRQ